MWRDLSTTGDLTVGGATGRHQPRPQGDPAQRWLRHRPLRRPSVPGRAGAVPDRAYQPTTTATTSTRRSTTRPTPARRSTSSRRCRSVSCSPRARSPPSGSPPPTSPTSPASSSPRTSRARPAPAPAAPPTTARSPHGTPLYTERITDGVYNLPGSTAYYGADGNGSAVVGSLAGVGALQQIDSGCGPTGKMVCDAAAIADPEIDYSDYDTDKDGVVDFFMVVFAGCGGNGASQLGAATPARPPRRRCPTTTSGRTPPRWSTTTPTRRPVCAGFTTDDQLKDLEGRPLWYTDDDARDDDHHARPRDALRSSSASGPTTSTPRPRSTRPA